jgi:sodium/potassium-transporting ATPase subunit alpha
MFTVFKFIIKNYKKIKFSFIFKTIPVFTNAFLGIPLPLSPFQMIAICVLTDICPALSLMLEKPEKKLLTQPPRSKNNHLVDWKLMFQAFLFIGLIETILSHVIFIWYLQWYGKFQLSDILFVFDKWEAGYKGHTLEQLNEFVFTGQTICFTSLVIMQSFGNLFSTRTNFRSFFQRLPFVKIYRNLWLFGGAFVSVILLILIIFLPFINSLFNTRPIPPQFFFIPLAFAAFIFSIDELRKLLIRKNILCCKKLSW